jgi:hypothetical protein
MKPTIFSCKYCGYQTYLSKSMRYHIHAKHPNHGGFLNSNYTTTNKRYNGLAYAHGNEDNIVNHWNGAQNLLLLKKRRRIGKKRSKKISKKISKKKSKSKKIFCNINVKSCTK